MTCDHVTPDGGCYFCRLAAKDARYAAVFKAVPAGPPEVRGAEPGKPLPCRHRGEDIPAYRAERMGLGTVRVYARCNSPTYTPPREFMSWCDGCRPGCAGYEPSAPAAEADG